MHTGRLMGIVAAALLVAACKGGEPPKRPLVAGDAGGGAAGGQATNPAGTLSPEAKTALDNGNQLYRAKQYKLALQQYRLAAALAPQHAAPWYGVYMVAHELKDKALADSAMAAVNARATGATPMFNDSLMKKAHTDPKGATAPKS